MAYRDIIIAEGTLLDYWPMDEASSATTLAALAGSTAIPLGTSTAKPTAGVTGQVDGTCVSFDGVNDFASVAVDLSGQSKVVVEFLINIPTFGSDDGIAIEYTIAWATHTGGFVFDANATVEASRMLIGINGSVGLNYKNYARFSTNAWHICHMELDFSQAAVSEVKFYVDGVLQTLTSSDTSSNNSGNFANATLYLFSRAGSSLFKSGKMQHLAIYTALSDARKTVHGQSAGIIGTAPNAPTSLAITSVTTTGANIGFDDGGDATITGFTLQIDTVDTFPSAISIAIGPSDVSVTFPSAIASGVPYFARIKATNTSGDSDWSTTATFTAQLASASRNGLSLGIGLNI